MSNELILGPGGMEIKMMSTKEIADLTSKQHGHVLRDCRKMFKELELDPVQFWTEFKSVDGRKLEMYNLDEELCTTLVTGYNTKLRNAVVKEWKKFRLEREQLTKAIQEADPKVLQHMANVALVAQSAREERDTAVRTKAQIGTSREATVMSRLAHLSPTEAFNEDRIRCLERARSRGLITVKEIGRRVRKQLGGRLVYHVKHTVEPDSNRPDGVNQALLDLGFQVEIPENQRDTSRSYKSRSIPWHRRYEIPAAGMGTDGIATHAGVVLSSVTSHQTKYGFEVKQSLQWDPNIVKAVYEYMQKIKRAKVKVK